MEKFTVDSFPLNTPCLVSIDGKLFILKTYKREKRFLLYPPKKYADERKYFKYIYFDGNNFYLEKNKQLKRIKIYASINPRRFYKLLVG